MYDTFRLDLKNSTSFISKVIGYTLAYIDLKGYCFVLFDRVKKYLAV